MFDPSEFAQGVTYRPRRTTKVLVIVGGLLLVAFGVAFALIPWFEASSSWADYLVAFLVGGIAIVLGGLCFPATRARLVLCPDRLESYTVFDLRKVKRAEIVGVRGASLYGTNKKALAHLSSLLVFDERVDRWLDGIPNLDAEDYQRAVREIEQDPRLGNTPEERMARHSRVRKWGSWLFGLSLVMTLWAIVWPHPRDLIMAVLVSLPLIPLLMLRRLGSSVEIDSLIGSPRNEVAGSIAGPVLGLTLRALKDCSPINQLDLLLPAVAALVVAATLVAWAAWRFRIGHLVMPSLLLTVHVFCALMLANQRFDPGPVSELQAEIVSKRQSDSKDGSSCYSVQVRWIDPDAIVKDIRVNEIQFRKLQVGNTLPVHGHPGALAVPWWSWSGRGGLTASRSCH